MRSHHREHLQADLREAIQSLLTRGLNDPRLDGAMCTITRLELSQDLRNATVNLSVLPDKVQKRAFAAVKHAEPHIRRQVAGKLDLHTPPLLAFVLDQSGKRQAASLAALAKVAEERERLGRTAPEGESGQTGLASHPSLGNPSDTPAGPQA